MAKERVSALNRAIQQAIGADRRVGREDDPAAQQFPALWEWLSTIYVGKDHVKQPAVLSIALGPEGVLVSLTDRDMSCTFNAATPHLGDAFKAMEAALNLPAPPMRSWGKKEPALRKRKGGG